MATPKSCTKDNIVTPTEMSNSQPGGTWKPEQMKLHEQRGPKGR